MASISRKLYGQRSIANGLRQFGVGVSDRIARKATNAAADILQREARQNINVRTGKGRRSVKKRPAKRTRDRTATEVYSDYKTLLPENYYTAILEYGWVTSTGRFVDEYEWMRPAFDQNFRRMKEEMTRVVRREVSRLPDRRSTG